MSSFPLEGDKQHVGSWSLRPWAGLPMTTFFVLFHLSLPDFF